MASPITCVVETADKLKAEQAVIQYVARPPEELTCSICFQVLCDPTLTSCCGQHFCRGCIDHDVCPLCNEKGFQTMLNKDKYRKVRELKVYCKLKAQGCGWVGELGALERHLDVANGDCEQQAQLEEALAWQDVRKQLEQQFKEELERQRVEFKEKFKKQHVQFEKKFKQQRVQLEEVAQRIVEEKLHSLIEQKMGAQSVLYEEKLKTQRVQFEERLQMQRVEFKSQMELQQSEYEKISALQSSDFAAKLEKVSLEFEYKEQKLQVDFEKHRKIDQEHLKSEFEKKELGLKEKHFGQHLQQKENTYAMKTEKRLLISIPPLEFTMTKFAAHKKNGADWYSPPFYSHPQGYRLCLRVCANGWDSGKGTHVSVYVRLMRGAFDDHLQLPFQGHVTIQLLNQRGDGETDRDAGTIHYNDAPASAGRVVGCEKAACDRGIPQFTAHTDLVYNATNNTEYLLNDCLRFRVSKIELTHPAYT